MSKENDHMNMREFVYFQLKQMPVNFSNSLEFHTNETTNNITDFLSFNLIYNPAIIYQKSTYVYYVCIYIKRYSVENKSFQMLSWNNTEGAPQNNTEKVIFTPNNPEKWIRDIEKKNAHLKWSPLYLKDKVKLERVHLACT